MHGKVMTVKHQSVNRRKDNRFAVALDSEQNNIHVKDIVKVIDGPHSVRIISVSINSIFISMSHTSRSGDAAAWNMFNDTTLNGVFC